MKWLVLLAALILTSPAEPPPYGIIFTFHTGDHTQPYREFALTCDDLTRCDAILTDALASPNIVRASIVRAPWAVTGVSGKVAPLSLIREEWFL